MAGKVGLAAPLEYSNIAKIERDWANWEDRASGPRRLDPVKWRAWTETERPGKELS
jgi:hypothetical protein